jgi:hypothetical protein
LLLAKSGEAEWVVAYQDYLQLTGRDTRELLTKAPTDRLVRPMRPRWTTDQGNAGMLVMTREAFDRVGGYDERFEKWGWEDWAIADALGTLVHGQVREPGFVLHLCHPRPLDQTKKQGGELMGRYTYARGDRDAMAALTSEPGRRGILL